MKETKVGSVVTVVTAMGEIVGRLKCIDDNNNITLSDPRLFVQVDAERAGFLPGICTTGEIKVPEITLYSFITVLPTNSHTETVWVKAVSGLLLQ